MIFWPNSMIMSSHKHHFHYLFASNLHQQMILHHPPSPNRRNHLTLIPAKTDVILINILVASLNLLDELTFGSVGIAHERPISHIIGKSGKEKGVLAISLKHLAELAEVTAKQRIRLLVR